MKCSVPALLLLICSSFLLWNDVSQARADDCDISKAMLADERRLVEYELEGEAVIDRVLQLANQGTVGYMVEDVENFLVRNLHRIPSTRFAIIHAWLKRAVANPALVDTFRQLEELTDPARLTGIFEAAAHFTDTTIPKDGQILRVQNPDGSFEAIGISRTDPTFANQSHILHKIKHPKDPAIKFSPLNFVDVSEDLTLKALALSDGRVVIKDQVHDQILFDQKVHKDWIHALKISPDGKTVITVSKDGTFALINLLNPKNPVLTKRSHPKGGSFTDAVFIPGKPWIAISDSLGNIFIWNYYSNQLQGPVLKGHRGAINTLAVSPGGNRLASGGSDGKVALWHVLQDRVISGKSENANRSPILSVTFGTEDTLAYATESGNIYTSHQRQRHVIPSPDGFPATSLAISPDGQIVAAIYVRSNTVTFFKTTQPDRPLQILELKSDPKAEFIRTPRLAGFVAAPSFVNHLRVLESTQDDFAAAWTASELRDKITAAKAPPEAVTQTTDSTATKPAAAAPAVMGAPPPPKIKPDRPTTRRFRLTKKQADPLVDPVTGQLRK